MAPVGLLWSFYSVGLHGRLTMASVGLLWSFYSVGLLWHNLTMAHTYYGTYLLSHILTVAHTYYAGLHGRVALEGRDAHR